MEYNYQFSETMTTGEIPENKDKRKVLADALNDWGVIMTGEMELPDNFGEVMVKVGAYLDVSATPDSLMKLAKRINK